MSTRAVERELPPEIVAFLAEPCFDDDDWRHWRRDVTIVRLLREGKSVKETAQITGASDSLVHGYARAVGAKPEQSAEQIVGPSPAMLQRGVVRCRIALLRAAMADGKVPKAGLHYPKD